MISMEIKRFMNLKKHKFLHYINLYESIKPDFNNMHVKINKIKFSIKARLAVVLDESNDNDNVSICLIISGLTCSNLCSDAK